MPRPPSPPSDKSASALIDQRVHELGDWRGDVLQRVRDLIHQVVPEVLEEWKWRGVPVWSHAGGICTGESYRAVVKFTFHNGAALKDPAKLFNSSLEGNVRRAIDFHAGDAVNAAALKKLVEAAVAFNLAKKKPGTKAAAPKASPAKKKAPAKRAPAKKKAPAGTKRAAVAKKAKKKTKKK